MAVLETTSPVVIAPVSKWQRWQNYGTLAMFGVIGLFGFLAMKESSEHKRELAVLAAENAILAEQSKNTMFKFNDDLQSFRNDMASLQKELEQVKDNRPDVAREFARLFKEVESVRKAVNRLEKQKKVE